MFHYVQKSLTNLSNELNKYFKNLQVIYISFDLINTHPFLLFMNKNR